MAIPKIYKNGIEITKPWSSEMYEYNDTIREYMIKEIQNSINMLSDEVTAQKLAKIINPYGYGEGYNLESMQTDMLKNAENFENYWLAEIWDELIDAEFATPNFGEGNEVYHIIGFESREEILELRKQYS
tara:strand:- start:3152 stop:3541 length:390 start_codon:yes stop_codon:yes gene_type:complete